MIADAVVTFVNCILTDREALEERWKIVARVLTEW